MLAAFEPRKAFIFVVDTDAYAGNFEREACAFITAQIGECGVGGDIADRVLDKASEAESKFFDFLEELVVQEADEHGCNRPVTIWPTPNWGSDGRGTYAQLTETNKDKYKHPAYQSVAIFFKSNPGEELFEFMKERAHRFFKEAKTLTKKLKLHRVEGIKVLAVRMLEVNVELKETPLLEYRAET